MKIASALVAVLLLAACGTQTSAQTSPGSPSSPAPVDRPDAVAAAEGEVTTGGPVTVLDDGAGAELCLGGVATSYPPQCGGPPLVGWKWSEHAGDVQTAGGVRWGEFVVTGAFDGTSVTPTEVLPADEWTGEPAAPGPDFTTPCPEPVGGWVVDAGRTSQEDMDRVFRRADQLPDFAYSFVDTSTDVGRWIVNVRVTGDRAAAEAALREVWGGGLCVLGAEHTDAELSRIQEDLQDQLPGVLGSGRGQDRVDVSVLYDDGSIQDWVDQEYGEGTVEVASALTPAG